MVLASYHSRKGVRLSQPFSPVECLVKRHRLSYAQWEELTLLLPSAKPGGRHRSADLREVGNGILYVLRSGCPWRMLPHDLPPWGTVWWYFRQWRKDGTWERIHETLRPKVREAVGREPTPSAAIIDSQSV
jgi:putative transposase